MSFISQNGLSELLQPAHMTVVVDVGANPIDGAPPYAKMLAAGLCEVIGFEPQADALAALMSRKGSRERYLPIAVGDGRPHVLNICRASGMTSLLQPNMAVLELFGSLRHSGEVIQKVPIQTCRLDDVAEIVHFDLIKIDIQGGELSVFRGGTARLSAAVAIHTEVSFITLYEGQPSFGDIDLELRKQGFVPHAIAALKKWPIAPCVVNGNPRQPLNQVIEADMVYVRDISRPALLSDEQLKQIALIAHHCYGSFDLALRCIVLLEQRKVLPTGAQRAYIDLVANLVAN